VDTHGMIDRAIAEGKRVAVPLSDLKARKLTFYEIRERSRDLKTGLYGIAEPDVSKLKPVEASSAGCVIVPGVLFDGQKRRIGHGAGFYDRFLGNEAKNLAKIAVCYSFQVVDRVPQETHDVAMDEILAG